MLDLHLPYPPSVNRIWRMVNNRMLISREGRRYRRHVAALLAAQRIQRMTGRLALTARVHPPDQRRRDLDNLQKVLLDALEDGGVYNDDSQIDLLISRRMASIPGGEVYVQLEELPLRRCPLCGRDDL